jgi:hypothetical protein
MCLQDIMAIFEGDFKNDVIEGPGRYFFANGKEYL